MSRSRGRIDDPAALRAPSECLDACRRAIHNAAFGLDHPSPLVALDDLGDQDMAPWTQPGPSTRARVLASRKVSRMARMYAAHPSVQTNRGRSAHSASPARSPRTGACRAARSLAPQPQAGRDHHRQAIHTMPPCKVPRLSEKAPATRKAYPGYPQQPAVRALCRLS